MLRRQLDAATGEREDKRKEVFDVRRQLTDLQAANELLTHQNSVLQTQLR